MSPDFCAAEEECKHRSCPQNMCRTLCRTTGTFFKCYTARSDHGPESRLHFFTDDTNFSLRYWVRHVAWALQKDFQRRVATKIDNGALNLLSSDYANESTQIDAAQPRNSRQQILIIFCQPLISARGKLPLFHTKTILHTM